MDKQSGAVALVGSGEYLNVMEETDRYLLSTVGGLDVARVVTLATAAGLEDVSSKERWTRMGLEHFRQLGATVQAVPIYERADTTVPANLELLEWGNFFYFSGGNPQHVIATLQGTPAWEIIYRKWQEGAVLAGCSAGAMAFGGYTGNIRATLMGGTGPMWLPALGLLPRVITLPHFDRMAGYIGNEAFQKIILAAPSGSTLIGVDEDTALVRTAPFDPANSNPRWQVMGRQTVSLFAANGQATVYKSGELVPLQEVSSL